MDLFRLLAAGLVRPEPSAAEQPILARRAALAERLGQARARLSALYALLDLDDRRDAALLLGLLAEDLTGLARDLGAAEDLCRDLAGLLAVSGPVQGAGAAAEGAARAAVILSRLDARLSERLKGDLAVRLDAYERRLERRALTAMLATSLLVVAAIVAWDAAATRNRAFVAAVRLEETRSVARRTVAALAEWAGEAKRRRKASLVDLTGENCTLCGCEDRDLRALPPGDKCARKWDQAATRLAEAAGRPAPAPAIGPEGAIRDPFGSPYLLNENERETPSACDPDTIASAGQDGIMGTEDDITARVPNLYCPDPPADRTAAP